jgi:hypothetical protein
MSISVHAGTYDDYTYDVRDRVLTMNTRNGGGTLLRAQSWTNDNASQVLSLTPAGAHAFDTEDRTGQTRISKTPSFRRSATRGRGRGWRVCARLGSASGPLACVALRREEGAGDGKSGRDFCLQAWLLPNTRAARSIRAKSVRDGESWWFLGSSQCALQTRLGGSCESSRMKQVETSRTRARERSEGQSATSEAFHPDDLESALTARVDAG